MSLQFSHVEIDRWEYYISVTQVRWIDGGDWKPAHTAISRVMTGTVVDKFCTININ